MKATLLPKGSRLTLTGQPGAVMQESAKAAQSFLSSHAEALSIDWALFKSAGVHIHVLVGAIPTYGPSAGLTIATALVAVYTGLPEQGERRRTCL
jgi:ATP-dependent Lon protease